MHLYAMFDRQTMSKIEACILEGNLGCGLPRSTHILSSTLAATQNNTFNEKLDRIYLRSSTRGHTY
jgi:hypothetical protein